MIQTNGVEFSRTNKYLPFESHEAAPNRSVRYFSPCDPRVINQVTQRSFLAKTSMESYNDSNIQYQSTLVRKQCPEAKQQHMQRPQEQEQSTRSTNSAMPLSVDNESSLSTIIMEEQEPIDSMESPPPSDRMIKTDLLETMKSPTMVQHFMYGKIIDDGNTTRSHDIMCIDSSAKADDDSHESLEAMISKSLSQIKGVMGEILNETSSSSTLRRKLMQRNSCRDISADDDDDDVIPPPSSLLRRCSTMGSVDMDLDGLKAELVSCLHGEFIIANFS